MWCAASVVVLFLQCSYRNICLYVVGLCVTSTSLSPLQMTSSTVPDVTSSSNNGTAAVAVDVTTELSGILSVTQSVSDAASVSENLLILTSSSADVFSASSDLFSSNTSQNLLNLSSSESDNQTLTTLASDLLTSTATYSAATSTVASHLLSPTSDSSSYFDGAVGSPTAGSSDVAAAVATSLLPSDAGFAAVNATDDSAIVPVGSRTIADDDIRTTTVADFSTADEDSIVLLTKPPPSPFVFTPVISVWLLIFIAVFVVFSFLLAAVVVCLVRARSQNKLCWTKQHQCYLPVPLFYQNGSNLVRVDASTAATAATMTSSTAPAADKVTAEMAPLTAV